MIAAFAGNTREDQPTPRSPLGTAAIARCFEMTDHYRQLIARVEAMPRNRPGAAKGSRWLGSRARKQAILRAVVRAPGK